jgi:hypothetical protein
MGMKCPICDTDNPSDSKHSKENARQLSTSEGVLHNRILAFETLIDEITAGAILARRFQIIQERGKSRQD